jgi:hypothetical protein
MMFTVKRLIDGVPSLCLEWREDGQMLPSGAVYVETATELGRQFGITRDAAQEILEWARRSRSNRRESWKTPHEWYLGVYGPLYLMDSPNGYRLPEHGLSWPYFHGDRQMDRYLGPER